MKRFVKNALVGLLILGWSLLLVFGTRRWVPPPLSFPASYWAENGAPGTKNDRVSHLIVYCFGLRTTYGPADAEFWPIVNAAYEAAEDWTITWEIVAAHGIGFQVSAEKARRTGVAVDVVYSRPLRPQTEFLKTVFQHDTIQLTFVESYVFPHHEDINPMWWNPYWVLTLGHGEVLRQALSEIGCQ